MKTFNVQLEHDDEETAFDGEKHGYVCILDGTRVLAESAGFQHNSNYRKVATASISLAEEAAQRFGDEQADTENEEAN